MSNKSANNFKKYFSLKYIFMYLFGLLLLIFGIAFGFVSSMARDLPLLSQTEMEKKVHDITENSDVYFSNGDKVATINSELIRKRVPLAEMGDNVKNAIIASEDSSFYSNMGIDPSAIIRASFGEATGVSSSGGSTLTQQLVKNQMLDNSRSYERKLKEILLSIRINNHFSKNEILEAYLNMAPFGKNKLGQNISGIETAALGVFGVNSKDLNIAQSAYLAGFVQSPFKYTPFDIAGNVRPDAELQAGFERQKYVLGRMLSEKYITKKQYEDALNFDIKSSFIEKMSNDGESYPYIANEVLSSAAEIFAEQTAKENGELEQYKTDLEYRNSLIEKSRIRFITGGYKVTTTIDKDLYDVLETAKNNYTGFISQTANGNTQKLEVGATIIENNTGKILAFIGGRDFQGQQLNHATRTFRSPGSTIKPLLVYAPAIEKGYITPNSQLLDRRFNFGGWRPENFSRTEYGNVSAKNALAKSLNLSTIRLYSAFYQEDPVEEYLQKMNFSRIISADHSTLAASIGGLTHGVSVTENTNAFATLANEGKFIQAHIIEEIKDNKGNTVYKANFEEKKVYTEETSYIITNMLNEVLTANGTAPDIANQLKFNWKNVFLKTGTSEYNHDLWTVGGTKNITFGLWTGYDSPIEIKGFNHAHNQWAYFMNAIYAFDPNLVAPDEKFKQPNSVINKGINPLNNANGNVQDLVPEGFKQLDNNKVLKKLGSFLDSSVSQVLAPPRQQTPVKQEEQESKEEVNKEDNEDKEEAVEIEVEEEETTPSSNSNG